MLPRLPICWRSSGVRKKSWKPSRGPEGDLVWQLLSGAKGGLASGQGTPSAPVRSRSVAVKLPCRGGSIGGRLAENAAAALAQARLLPVHAGDDPRPVGNFR